MVVMTTLANGSSRRTPTCCGSPGGGPGRERTSCRKTAEPPEDQPVPSAPEPGGSVHREQGAAGSRLERPLDGLVAEHAVDGVVERQEVLLLVPPFPQLGTLFRQERRADPGALGRGDLPVPEQGQP